MAEPSLGHIFMVRWRVRPNEAREMPSFCILEFKVVRGSPSRAAAPLDPPTIQFVSASAWMMCSRSASFRVRGLEGSFSLAAPGVISGSDGSANDSRRTLPGEKMTARSIRSTRIFQVKILAADFRAKEVGHCVGTVFANIKGAERAVKRRERNRACEPVVAGV